MNRRAILAAVAAAAAGLLGATGSHAQQAYPNKPIRLVVPYPAGGGADGLARLIGSKMADKLGQSVVIENKPGANTMLASSEVARQPADGYTLLYVASSFTINPSLYKVPYDTERAFAPVAMVAEVPLIIIRNQKASYNTLADLIKAAKAKPGQINYASYGQGSPAHLGGELLESMADVDMTHIPYKGSAPALNDLLGGQVEVAFSSIEPALQLIRSNRVHPIAVMTSKRIAALPNVPAVAETYPGFEAIGWNGIVAPAGTPAPIVSRLNQVINEAVKSPEVQQAYAKQGVEADPMTPDAFGKLMKDEIVKWGEVVKKAGVKVE
ncbi:tripartite tricarboxylate transporter substrate binding protein [Ramlibacter tataouinensis]|uniref:Candidate extracytoplasmic binding receptor n=1 Tax=Ramlibacter tataouinensis (strain ATCC BAA-407 / DSM 14655 / LMG 21543 / TTB310) TaxID=365046 RepID=F5Y446_RAMTT|nr:tripartite tricarboxylate transporter substrate binding protein [Ramlibacter tataouinensis]AEG92511.1 Candidate extracytoplasmic binding receptor [Ramlibacter tataouinensis TTB310]